MKMLSSVAARSVGFSLLGALCLSSVACGSWETLPHEVTAAPSTHPHEDFVRLINTQKVGVPADVDIGKDFATMLYIGQSSVRRISVEFARVGSFSLMHHPKRGHWVVWLNDGNGDRMFRFNARDEKQAREFINVVSMLREFSSTDDARAQTGEAEAEAEEDASQHDDSPLAARSR
jgi:hypothetical protein